MQSRKRAVQPRLNGSFLNYFSINLEARILFGPRLIELIAAFLLHPDAWVI